MKSLCFADFAKSNADMFSRIVRRENTPIRIFPTKGSIMFRGHGFYHSSVKVQPSAVARNPRQHPMRLRSRRQKFIPTLYPSLFLAMGVAIAGIAAIALGRLV
ncbi:hypothetical protein [Phyllobacterium myrsinacearum]|uniref:Uncharacterized protein n=1 Tax=Phyllobacterium myrsinacearum TaxID=28101 RepID=A0A839EL02_9HYPH|nr:hypothetical protein [Phyllobacterium myrsinacearum]MBA8878154.1 hypothetical protein [Phyllobacterium myrsinacearum]